ncbi:MAG: AAA family ATPase [Phycisphaerae bacterium]|nr:AAA family ATPase [Phycisphaerae bacterium]
MANNMNQDSSKSLLESILVLMSSEQQEHFLKYSSAEEIIYANKLPVFDQQLSILLTKKVYYHWVEIYKKEILSDVSTLQNAFEVQFYLDELKNCLEMGVSFHTLHWKEGNDGEEKAFVYIQSSLLEMKCIMETGLNKKAYFKAIHSKSFNEFQKDRIKTKNESFVSSEVFGEDVPIDTDVIDVGEIIHDHQILNKGKPKQFIPQIKMIWNVHSPYSQEIQRFDSEAVLKIIWENFNNQRLAMVLKWTRKHLRELGDIVNLGQLAMQFRYELVSQTETSKGRYCKIKINAAQEDIANMKLACVYAEDKEADNKNGNNFRNIKQFLKRRLKKALILEMEDCKGDIYYCNIFGTEEMPSEGLLVDVGLESQIKKKIEAMHNVSFSKGMVHLLKLATLLGKVGKSKLELFSWDDKKLKLYDELLTGRQREAVLKALNTPDICLVQGPPGTGKTRIISEIVQQASKRGYKILLTAPTHVAVDNVLERLGCDDNTSPIRCVNKDKLESLPEHIRQFTYEQRKSTLAVNSQKRVKADIYALNKEKLRLVNVSNMIQRLCTLHDDKVKLLRKEKRLIKKYASIEKTVKEKFAEKLNISERIKLERENILYGFRQHYALIDNEVKVLRLRCKEYKSDQYTDIDKNRFDLGQLGVDRNQGKSLGVARSEYSQANIDRDEIKRQIEQTGAKLGKIKETLLLLGKGEVPANIYKIIRGSISSLEKQQAHIVAKKCVKLKETKNNLCKHNEEVCILRNTINELETKQRASENIKHKPLLSKLFNGVWWQSKFNDYQAQETIHKRLLADSLVTIARLETAIEKLKLRWEKSKQDKNEKLDAAYKSELITQNYLLKSNEEELALALSSMNGQLQQKNTTIESLDEKVKLLQKDYDRASGQIIQAVKKQLHKELVNQIKKLRKDLVVCKADIVIANNIYCKAKIDFEKIQLKVLESVKDKVQKNESDIEKLNKDIHVNNSTTLQLQCQAALFFCGKPPDKPSARKKVLKELEDQLSQNERRIAFSESWLDCLRRNTESLSLRLAKYTNLICATTIGIASDDYFGDGKPFEQKEFDLLIIDEAGKVTEPEFLVAATRAKKWVIVGDHKQLPPYYDRKLNDIFLGVNKLRSQDNLSMLDPIGLQISYFENLWNQLSVKGDGIDKAKARLVTLDVQRRMHPDIARFISDMFYPNEYNSPDEPEFLQEKTLELSRFKCAITFIEVIPPKAVKGYEANLNLWDNRKDLKLFSKTGYANLTEARKMVEVLVNLLGEESVFAEQRELNDKNDSSSAIGVIAFYAGQVELISELIKEEPFLEAEELSSAGHFLCKGKVNVTVNTVDSFQGKECPIVILSFTRSNSCQNIGFVKNSNRLNVAMSRARKKLILLGDTKTFVHRAMMDESKIKGDDTRSISAESIFFKKLVQYIEGYGEIKKAFHVWRQENGSV